MIQTEQYNFYSGYSLVNLCTLVINNWHNDYFILLGVAEKTDNWSSYTISLIMSGIL